MGQHDKTHRVIYSIAIDALPPITLNRSGNDKDGTVRPRDALRLRHGYKAGILGNRDGQDSANCRVHSCHPG